MHYFHNIHNYNSPVFTLLFLFSYVSSSSSEFGIRNNARLRHLRSGDPELSITFLLEYLIGTRHEGTVRVNFRPENVPKSPKRTSFPMPD